MVGDWRRVSRDPRLWVMPPIERKRSHFSGNEAVQLAAPDFTSKTSNFGEHFLKIGVVGVWSLARAPQISDGNHSRSKRVRDLVKYLFMGQTMFPIRRRSLGKAVRFLVAENQKKTVRNLEMVNRDYGRAFVSIVKRMVCNERVKKEPTIFREFSDTLPHRTPFEKGAPRRIRGVRDFSLHECPSFPRPSKTCVSIRRGRTPPIPRPTCTDGPYSSLARRSRQS